MRGREQKCAQGFWWKTCKKGSNLEDPGIDEKDGIIMDLKRNGMELKDWVQMAQDRDKQ